MGVGEDFWEKVNAMDYVWDEDRDDIIFFGTVYDLTVLHTVVANCTEILNKSTNPREMVLETWLTLDFALRQFLLAGFELTRFCDEDFDLRDSLLPSNFRALLKLFKDTVKYNSKFSLEPEPHTPDKTGGFKSSYEFWSYVKNRHPKLHSKIIEVTKEYRLEKNPELPKIRLSNGKEVVLSSELISSEPLSLTPPKRKIERMSLEWRKVANRFGKSWFRAASQLNEVRNKAAHSHDVNIIGLAFGLRGDNLTEKVRKKCLLLLNALLGLKID